MTTTDKKTNSEKEVSPTEPITAVQQEALMDLVRGLVKNEFLHTISQTDEYDEYEIIRSGSKAAATKPRLKYEDDFLDECNKMHLIIIMYMILYYTFSHDRIFDQNQLYQKLAKDRNFKEDLDSLFNYSRTRETIYSEILNSYKDTWEDIYRALTQNTEHGYKKEDVEKHTNNISTAVDIILNNFILLVRTILIFRNPDLPIQRLSTEELRQRFTTVSMESIPPQNLFIKSSVDRIENRELLIVQDPSSQFVGQLASLQTQEKGHVPKSFVMILKLNKKLLDDIMKQELPVPSVERFTIKRFRNDWIRSLSELEIPTQFRLEDAIDRIILFVSILLLIYEDVRVLIEKGGRTEDKREVISIYNEASELDPYNADIWDKKGNIHMELEEYENAQTCYERAIQVFPDNAEAWNNKGSVFDKLGRYDEAWNSKGRANYIRREYDEAIACYDKALEINPKNAEAWNNKGRALNDLKKYQRAIECYERALEIEPTCAEAWNNKGSSLRNMSKFEEALMCYKKAIEINPKFDAALNNIGKVLLDSHKDDEAMEYFDKSIEVNPSFPNAWNNKGRVLYNKAMYEEAIACYDKALEIKADVASWWNNKANANRELKNYDEAIACYDKALAIDPTYGAPKNNKTRVLRLMGREKVLK